MNSLSPLQNEINVLKRTPAKMAFNKNTEVFSDWQCSAREKLSELLGLPYEKCSDKFNIEWVHEEDNFTETRFLFQSEDGYFVPCHFVEPYIKYEKKPPVMICLQGHSTGMHISLGRAMFEGDEKSIATGDRDYALRCVKEGMCAVTLEQRCFGECGGVPKPDCHAASMTALLTGRTVLGGRVWDVMRLIDVLNKHFSDKCDTERIYCMGNSGGGTATFYASALDERIKAAMPSCAFCTFEESIGTLKHCECNYIPGIRRFFDMAEIAAMTAPRPIVIVSGEEDLIFPIQGARREFARLKNDYYSQTEQPKNCVHVIGGQGHRFYADKGFKAFNSLINKNV